MSNQLARKVGELRQCSINYELSTINYPETALSQISLPSRRANCRWAADASAALCVTATMVKPSRFSCSNRAMMDFPRSRCPDYRSARRQAAGPARLSGRGQWRYAASPRRKADAGDGRGDGSGQPCPAIPKRGLLASRRENRVGNTTFSSTVRVGSSPKC